MNTKMIFCILLAWLSARGLSQDATYETYNLKNGLKVYLIKYGQLPAMNIKLVMNTGHKNEAPGQQGYSDLAANAMLFGNAKYDLEAQNNKQFRLGTDLAVSNGKDRTSLSMNLLSKDLTEGFDLLSAVALSPLFPKDKIDLLKSQFIDFNSPSKMDIAELADVFSNYFLFGLANPFGRYYYKAQLDKITPEILKEYYHFNFTPKNCSLVICGNFDVPAVKAAIDSYFGAWKSTYGDVNSVSLETPVIKKKEIGFINRRGATQCALQWYKIAPSLKDKDYLAFSIANKIFGTVLFKEIREKGGKTYGINSTYEPSQFANLIAIKCSVRSNELCNTITLFDKTLLDFSNTPVTDKQLSKAIAEETARIKRIETPDAISAFYNPLVYDFEKRKNYLTELNALKPEDINKVIKKYYTPNVYKLVFSGDEAQVSAQLQQLPNLVKFNPSDIEKDN